MELSQGLTDREWYRVRVLVPVQKETGRKRTIDERLLVGAIAWKIRSVTPENRRGNSWRDLPDRFPHWQTVRNYFATWLKNGALTEIAAELDMTDQLLLFCEHAEERSAA